MERDPVVPSLDGSFYCKQAVNPKKSSLAWGCDLRDPSGKFRQLDALVSKKEKGKHFDRVDEGRLQVVGQLLD